MDVIMLTWDEVEKLCVKLYDKIKKNFEFDIIIAICRGGWVPARIISDISGNKNLGNIRVESYNAIHKGKPKVTQDVSVSVEGKKILLVDDVSDTGDSLILAKEYLTKKKPLELRTATLHYKPKSRLKPDFFVDSTEKWIIYPWEKNETLTELKKKGIEINY